MTLESAFAAEVAAENESFIAISKVSEEFDWKRFKDLTSILFDIASKYGGSAQCPRWIVTGYNKMLQDVPELLRGLPSNNSELIAEQVSLIEDLAFYFTEGESPYDLETLELLAKDW